MSDEVHVHKTVPIQVWADVDEGIVEMVRHLNTLEGVRTEASCQGTIGEGGAEPYGPQVLVSWTDDAARDRIAAFYDVEDEGTRWGYARPRTEPYDFLGLFNPRALLSDTPVVEQGCAATCPCADGVGDYCSHGPCDPDCGCGCAVVETEGREKP